MLTAQVGTPTGADRILAYGRAAIDGWTDAQCLTFIRSLRYLTNGRTNALVDATCDYGSAEFRTQSEAWHRLAVTAGGRERLMEALREEVTLATAIEARLLPKVDPLKRLATLSEVAETIECLLCWAEGGYAAFDLLPDFFHAIACTDFGDAGDDVLRSPLPTFVIRLPADLSETFGRTIICHSILLATATDLQRNMMVSVTSLDGQRRLTLLVNLASSVNAIMEQELGSPLTQASTPVVAAEGERLRRVVLNTLLYVNAHGGLPTAKHKGGAAPAPVERTTHGPTFRVGRPVRLSAIMREALAHGDPTGRKLAARYIVRGHWRNQAHGPGRTLRKRLWIEPFWKGPASLGEALERTYTVEG